jgi:allophanate hydrolase
MTFTSIKSDEDYRARHAQSASEPQRLSQSSFLLNKAGMLIAYKDVYKKGFLNMTLRFSIAQPIEPSASTATHALPAHAWISKPEQPLSTTDHGVLSGLSFAVKDNIDVAGLPTTAACPDFSRIATQSAEVVRQLLSNGASLLGKTNLDQFACGLNGTRSAYGAVPNAFDASLVSGGSSAGSAYVVATGQVDFSLGTDTAGSGRVPAGLNNIVGLKPSRGLLSARGVLPAAQSVDCVSIFARSVEVAWRVLMAGAQYDAQDPYSRRLTLSQVRLGASFRFGVPKQLEWFGDQHAETEFGIAIDRLVALGGIRVEIDYTPLAKIAELLYGSALVAERYQAIREFFDQHEQSVLEPVRSIIAAGKGYSAADVFDAQTEMRRLAQQLDGMWDAVDLLFVPTAATHYTIQEMRARPVELNRNLGHYTNFVNLLDYAALSVPSSIREDGLPFGVTLIGPCASDWVLAELGARYQDVSALPLGATQEFLQGKQTIPPAIRPTEETICVAVVGAHLSGMPLNGQLTERGARLVSHTKTAAHYKLYALNNTKPLKPGLLRLAEHAGHSIEVEVWEMPLQHYGSFVSLIASPLGIGTLVLCDGSTVQGFICEPQALTDALEITHFGGWRAYLQSLAGSKSV